MALADILRARAAFQGRSAPVACGALGQVTVEALPVRDLELLLGQSDGARKVFYAACRELQQCGEELRREGRLFTPDQALEFVSDEEAELAARTVMTLSGLDPDRLPAPGRGPDPAGAAADAAETQRAVREGGDRETPAAVGEPGTDPAEAEKAPSAGRTDGHGADLPVRGDPSSGTDRSDRADLPDPDRAEGERPAERPASDNGANPGGERVPADPAPAVRTASADRADPAERTGRTGSAEKEVRPELSESTEIGENRPASVRNERESFRKVRPASVQSGGEKSGGAGENRPDPVQFPEETGAEAGQVSRETGRKKVESGELSRPDTKTQGMGSVSPGEAQNVAPGQKKSRSGAQEDPSGGPRREDWKEPLPERMHEIKSELPGETGERTHETESEFRERVHEAESEFPEGMHETESDFRAERPRALHESKSVFPESLHEVRSEVRETMHESESDPAELLHEYGSELGELAARALLEGLRRARWVRGG